MATITRVYATKATINLSLASVANAAGRQSDVVDNGTNKYLDALVRVITKGQAGGTGLLDLYVYSALGGTTYTDGATGSDAAFTAANRLNAKYLGSVQMNTTNAVSATFSVAAAFGGILPEKWGLIAINNSGATMSTTSGDHVTEYQGIGAAVA